MKNYELTLVMRHEGKTRSINKIEGDDLVQLLSQFNIMLVMEQRRFIEDLQRELILMKDDDIPF